MSDTEQMQAIADARARVERKAARLRAGDVHLAPYEPFEDCIEALERYARNTHDEAIAAEAKALVSRIHAWTEEFCD